VYLRLCRQVLEIEEHFLVEMENQKNQAEGSVKVAAIYSVGIAYMQKLQEEFAARLPGAQVNVYYMRPEKVYEEVLEGRVELGLVSYPEGSREIAVIPWREEEMAVAVYPAHRLAARKFVVAKDLHHEDFIALDSDLTISREVDRYLTGHDCMVYPKMQFDNIQSIKEAVAIGSGISVLPAQTLTSEVKRGVLVALPLRGDPELKRPVGIVHLKRKRFNRATQAFLDLLQEQPEPALSRR
jgi:DNA-binding transcriptional LysR family regulator